MALIYISTAEGDPLKYRLPDLPGTEILVGRDEGCQIALPQVNGISGVHCSFYFDGTQYYIIDHQSTNGVFCNGERIENAVLKRGDVYTIGEANIVFDPEVAAAAPSIQAGPAQTAPAQAAPAGAAAPRRRRKVSPAAHADSLASRVVTYQVKKTSPVLQVFTYIYVVVMLGIAFYGGMVLRHWNETGQIFFPWIDPDPQTASPEAASKA